MNNSKGFWSGMPGHLKIRAVCFALYFVIAAIIFTQQPVLGTVLLVLPGLWYLLKNWVIAHFYGTLDVERKDTLSGYALGYLLNRASNVTRVIVGGLTVVLVVFGLGWVSTEDLRLKAAEPTLTERVSGAAGSAMAATKETTGGWVASAKDTTSGWVSSAKGWFSDETEEANAE